MACCLCAVRIRTHARSPHVQVAQDNASAMLFGQSLWFLACDVRRRRQLDEQLRTGHLFDVDRWVHGYEVISLDVAFFSSNLWLGSYDTPTSNAKRLRVSPVGCRDPFSVFLCLDFAVHAVRNAGA